MPSLSSWRSLHVCRCGTSASVLSAVSHSPMYARRADLCALTWYAPWPCVGSWTRTHQQGGPDLKLESGTFYPRDGE